MSKKAQLRRRGETAQRRRTHWFPLALIAAGVIVLGGVVWVALGGQAAGIQAPVEVTGSPRLKANRQRVDLGEMQLGETAEVSFQLANVGDETLTFTEAPFITVAEGC